MKTRLLALTILFGSAGFGQGSTTNPLGGLAEAYREGVRLKLEKQNAESQQNLMNAQAEAVRAETERLRLQTERMKQATAPAKSQASPVDALVQDAEFSRLPMALRIRFVKLVAPDLSQYSDQDMATVLSDIASKVLGPPLPLPPFVQAPPK